MNEAERTMGDIKGIFNPNILCGYNGILSIPLGKYYLRIVGELHGLDIREINLCFKEQYGTTRRFARR